MRSAMKGMKSECLLFHLLKMNKYKKVLYNSFVFAVGNFGSRFISLFMVPVYTFILSAKDYGRIDLLTNTVSLLLPFITLALDQAVVRFTMKQNKQLGVYITSALYLFWGLFILFTLVLYPLLKWFSVFQDSLSYFFIIVLLNGIQLILLQFCRGIGRLKIYALNGILQTIFLTIANFVFLFKWHWGVTGYYFSVIIGFTFSIGFLMISTKVWQFVKLVNFDITIIKEMLSYSLPLIPNGTMWWLVNNSTRYIIFLFLGVTGNGLFAVATKLPTIINAFTGVFTQAWQLSAFEEYKSADRSDFYSIVFQSYYQFLFIISSAIMIAVLPFTTFIISESFFESWKMIAALILGAIFQTLSGFIGSIYTATMQTKGVFSSSVIGALLSIGSNFLFIPLLGITGAGIGTALGFFFMFLVRLRDTKKLVETKINVTLFLSNITLFILQAIVLSVTYQNLILNIVGEFCLFIIIIAINKNVFSQIYHRFNM